MGEQPRSPGLGQRRRDAQAVVGAGVPRRARRGPGAGGRPEPAAREQRHRGQRSLRPNSAGASDFLWQWGQFLDHDIVETPIADPAEPMDIPVPRGDIYFDPQGTGVQTIAFNRSAYETPGGVREQLNNITAYIDASMVYGSEHGRADELRVFDGTGRLRTSEGGLLPFNVNGFDNAPTAHDPSYFLAGDIRANEQVGLTAMHTLFVREHNRWAAQIASQHPGMGGDEIYERARAMVAAEVQAITYNEFLPLLLGPDAIPPYRGYEPMANAGISNGFATAAYRVGHTMLSSTIRRLGADGFAIDAGHLPLANAFFAPREIVDHGIDPVLRGLASQRAQEIDEMVIDDVRNFLFGPPGAGGFDLASLNIQRGATTGCPATTRSAPPTGCRP
jgi:peroxidase